MTSNPLQEMRNPKLLAECTNVHLPCWYLRRIKHLRIIKPNCMPGEKIPKIQAWRRDLHAPTKRIWRKRRIELDLMWISCLLQGIWWKEYIKDLFYMVTTRTPCILQRIQHFIQKQNISEFNTTSYVTKWKKEPWYEKDLHHR